MIVLVGWTRGFKSLEQMEYVSVSVKLAIIAAVSAARQKSGLRVAIYGTLAVLGIAIVLFGQSVEG